MYRYSCRYAVVDALSKIENLKAIHNGTPRTGKSLFVVDALSKIENLKAIHNVFSASAFCKLVVDALSKIENLKAIHNITFNRIYWNRLLMLYRR